MRYFKRKWKWSTNNWCHEKGTFQGGQFLSVSTASSLNPPSFSSGWATSQRKSIAGLRTAWELRLIGSPLLYRLGADLGVSQSIRHVSCFILQFWRLFEVWEPRCKMENFKSSGVKQVFLKVSGVKHVFIPKLSMLFSMLNKMAMASAQGGCYAFFPFVG